MSEFRMPDMSRRSLLRAGAGLALLGGLSACAKSKTVAAGGDGQVVFWDMPWAQDSYNKSSDALVKAYKPADGLPAASLQRIQWNNFTTTFSSALASKTGPAVSTGGGFQAFQFAEEGYIATADNLVKKWDAEGFTQDFLPGTLEAMKTDAGYVAVPWQTDMRVWWYRKSAFEDAGVDVPKTWDELVTAGKALKSKGYVGFGVGAGAGNNLGAHTMVLMMINNGGGLFTPDGQLDLLNERNVEAMEFVIRLVKEGITDPAAVSYTSDNQLAQWKNKKFAFGLFTAALDEGVGDTTGDLLVAEPLTGGHGDKVALAFGNNIMMYTNTPSQEGTEAFLDYYIKNMKAFWQQKVVNGMPVLQSIVDLPEFQASENKMKVIAEYQPVARTYGSRSTSLFAAMAQVDGGQPLAEFTQTVLSGKTDAKTALTTLEKGLSAIVKS
ncbi:ABC transporter substrate-binding protein [Kineosporia babensis]|uniref:Extracellular solute-binding protein n=1 Tax=Kineosporia babensis TaxID=499548 RepID=A0A9X1NE41_9ACTN|nr:extracellular solute-binding protein [Kineosporia babensis]MCD5312120.1 extracellular solute-binding protein [Kineosporia babensis]